MTNSFNSTANKKILTTFLTALTNPDIIVNSPVRSNFNCLLKNKDYTNQLNAELSTNCSSVLSDDIVFSQFSTSTLITSNQSITLPENSTLEVMSSDISSINLIVACYKKNKLVYQELTFTDNSTQVGVKLNENDFFTSQFNILLKCLKLDKTVDCSHLPVSLLNDNARRAVSSIVTILENSRMKTYCNNLISNEERMNKFYNYLQLSCNLPYSMQDIDIIAKYIAYGEVFDYISNTVTSNSTQAKMRFLQETNNTVVISDDLVFDDTNNLEPDTNDTYLNVTALNFTNSTFTVSGSTPVQPAEISNLLKSSLVSAIVTANNEPVYVYNPNTTNTTNNTNSNNTSTDKGSLPNDVRLGSQSNYLTLMYSLVIFIIALFN
jgi:hypothetical protein